MSKIDSTPKGVIFNLNKLVILGFVFFVSFVLSLCIALVAEIEVVACETFPSGTFYIGCAADWTFHAFVSESWFRRLWISLRYNRRLFDFWLLTFLFFYQRRLIRLRWLYLDIWFWGLSWGFNFWFFGKISFLNFYLWLRNLGFNLFWGFCFRRWLNFWWKSLLNLRFLLNVNVWLFFWFFCDFTWILRGFRKVERFWDLFD